MRVVLTSAYSSDEEPFRIDRLHRVYGWACCLAHREGLMEEFIETCIELHDHKGQLTVTWSKIVPLFKGMVEQAWENGGYETEESVSHQLPTSVR